MENVFELVNSLNISKEQLREFMADAGFRFSGRGFKYHCDFHGDDKTPSGSVAIKDGKPFFHCFACSTGGDIIKFAERAYNLSSVDAAKRVLDYFGVSYENHNATQMSEAQIAKRAAELASIEKRKAENKAKAEAEAKIEAINYEKTLKRINELAPNLLENRMNMWGICENEFKEVFPNYSANVKYIHRYAGYCPKNQSIVMIIPDANGRVVNMKYRYKNSWDANAKDWVGERMAGKWIGEKGAKAQAFPLGAFNESEDERVIICEGEKDALNLYGVGARALTLGGVTAKWESDKELLRDKIVYIWFDNDRAGYENAIKRYFEISPVAKACYCVFFYKINSSLPAKYDISDFIKERSITSDIYEHITFSSFVLTNELIDEIAEIYDVDFSEYRVLNEPITWKEIQKELAITDKDGNYINILRTKGEIDDAYFESICDNWKNIKKDKEYFTRFKETFLNQFLRFDDENFSKFAATFDSLLDIADRGYKNYRQTHVADMVNSLMLSFAKLGYSFGESKGSLYIWNKNYYMNLDLRAFLKWALSFFMVASRIDVKKQLERNAKELSDNVLARALHIDEARKEPFLAGKRVVNLLNGSLIITKNGKVTFVKEHNKALCATNILNFNYDKNALCPKWQAFLDSVIPNKDDQKTLMEFMGYCLLPNHNYESFLFLYGRSGANGKSVILDVLRSFFGDENVSSLQLQQFCGHELHALSNKIINIGSEIDKLGIDNGQLSNLKALVSPKDRLQINPKNQDPYSLEPSEKPKLAFAGNDKPKGNMDNAVFRRMLLISFDKEITDDKKIRGLSDRFDDEKGGILNMALLGLERLIKQGSFTKSQKMRDELEAYKDEVSPLRAFVRDYLIVDENYKTPSAYVRGLYLSWCENTGAKPLSATNFTSRLCDELKTSQNGEAVLGGQTFRMRAKGFNADTVKGFKGLRVNTSSDIGAIVVNDVSVSVDEMSSLL